MLSECHDKTSERLAPPTSWAVAASWAFNGERIDHSRVFGIQCQRQELRKVLSEVGGHRY